MEKKYLAEMNLLRKRIPVGIRQGMVLLEKTCGDIVAATDLFKQDSLSFIIAKIRDNKKWVFQLSFIHN